MFSPRVLWLGFENFKQYFVVEGLELYTDHLGGYFESVLVIWANRNNIYSPITNIDTSTGS